MDVNKKFNELIEVNKKLRDIVYEKLHIKNEDKDITKNKIDKLQNFISNELIRIDKVVKQLINQKNKNNNNSKEKQVVEKAKPVYLETFSDKAILELNNLFQKIFNIKIIQPKEEISKKSNIWLLALIAVTGLIIAKFNDIKKYILSIDWDKIWQNIRKQIIDFLTDLPFQIIDNLNSVFEFIKDIIINIFSSDQFKSLIDNIKKTIVPTNLIDNIVLEITNLFTVTIPNIFNSVITNIKQFVNNIFKSINDLLGFQFFDVGKDETNKTDAINAEEKIDSLNNLDNEKSSPPANSSNNYLNEQKNIGQSSLEPNIAIANNMNNFNKISGGNINKSLIVNDTGNITMTPLQKDDTAIILKEDGIIDKRLNEVINAINNQANNYIEKFDTINNELIQQNNILSKFNNDQKQELTKTIQLNNVITSQYIQNNINKVQSSINELKQPKIERSNIDTIRLNYLNG